jgi:uncharacterized Fe-S cluster-containing radical SAM superfamily protein
MEAESINPALQVTGACNKNCDACLRPPKLRKHHLRQNDFSRYLADLATLSGSRKIKYQFVTGGEPTIWRDREMDITDLLAALTDLGYVGTIVMPTNGMVLEDRLAARELLCRLVRRISRPIVVGVSVASYQHNLDASGCAALENLLALRQELAGKVIPIALVTLSVDDDTYDLLSREYPRLYKRVTALAPMGGAAEMREACPSLSLGGSDKSTLGSFLPHFKKDVVAKLKLSEDEFLRTPNAEIVNGLSFYNNCGKSPFVDTTWHYCLPFLHHAPFDLCALGQMESGTIQRTIDRLPFLQAIRRLGVVAAMRELRGSLPEDARQRLDQMFDPSVRVSAAYRGCMVCRELYDRLAVDEGQAASVFG